MADDCFVRSEVLCFVQNNYQPRGILEMSLCGFYKNDELLNAKNKLFEVAGDLVKNRGLSLQLPRNIVRRSSGEARKRDDVNDFLDLWNVLVNASVDLPTFYACDLSRVPPIALADRDLSSLVLEVMETKGQTALLLDNLKSGIETLLGKICEISDVEKDKNDKIHTSLSSFGSKMEESLTVMRNIPSGSTNTRSQDNRGRINRPTTGPSTGQSGTSSSSSAVTAVVGRTYASVVDSQDSNTGHVSNDHDGHSETNADKFTVVSRRRRPKPVKTKGTKLETIQSKLRSAPRPPPRLTAYVGRLDKDTSEQDLIDHLLENGIKDPRCRLLTVKDGRTFMTAAFMVSCDEESKDAFFDGSRWPAGCELRDWIFYGRQKKSTSTVNANP